jgi:hypothetical protein
MSKNDRNLYLSHERYVAFLERVGPQVRDGLPLVAEDSDEIGNKYTQATWGMCSREKEQWPDAEDHLWPDQFMSRGRVAPLYRVKPGTEQICPFDRRLVDEKLRAKTHPSNGCFYTCRIFQRKYGKTPTREEAVELYQIALKRAKESP